MTAHRSLMDRLGNLPVVGGVFVFLTSIGGLVVTLVKAGWGALTKRKGHR